MAYPKIMTTKEGIKGLLYTLQDIHCNLSREGNLAYVVDLAERLISQCEDTMKCKEYELDWRNEKGENFLVKDELEELLREKPYLGKIIERDDWQ